MAYRTAAEAATTFLRTALWDERARRFRPAIPREKDALPWDFMWANGIAFSAIVGGVAADAARYRPWLEAFFDGLDGYWDRWAPIPAYDAYLASPDGDDKYYDDNAWMVLTFVEAYERTGDRRFLERAAATQRYVLSGWDERQGGGICWRQDRTSKNTCSNAPAATGALALGRHLNPRYHTAWARRIVAWTRRTLQAPDGTFLDNIHADTGKIEGTRWTYNTALMLRANLGLHRATGETGFLDEARRLARASETVFVDAQTGAFRDDAVFSHLLVEAYLDLFDTTAEAYLLARARACADFCLSALRDPADGGFWTVWKRLPDRREPRKTLTANAANARLLWLVSRYDTPGRSSASVDASRGRRGKAT
jgi:uncharacterized protein YyaL (SSP411 family)